jgi:hypothetical protein
MITAQVRVIIHMVVSSIVIPVFRTQRRVTTPLNFSRWCVTYKIPPYVARKPVIVSAIPDALKNVM